MQTLSKPFSLFKYCLLLAVLSCVALYSAAQPLTFGNHAGISKPSVSTALTGTALAQNATVINDYHDNAILNPAAGATLDAQQPSVIKHAITLKLVEETPYIIPKGFTATIKVNVSVGANLDAATNAAPIIHDQFLVVTYDPSAGATYNARNYLSFDETYTGAECVIVTVKSVTTEVIVNGTTTTITNLPNTTTDARNVLSLENQIEPTYYYDLKTNALPYVFSVPGTVAANANGIMPDEMMVTWSWVKQGSNGDIEDIGNNYTQLEWTWLEDEMADAYKVNDVVNTDLLFKNNATRVDLPPAGIQYYDNNNPAGVGYKIPLLYDGTGHIYCRIRAVDINADGSIVTGPWCTTNMSNGGTPGAVAAAAFGGHNNNLNWQATTSYAEEGKRKSVIQYYDGSLRGRQTITKDNSTNTVVTAESFYDKQGRPAIQILPTPGINGADNIIAYQQNLNLFNNQLPGDDPSDLFDLVAVNSTPALNTSSGSARYYSSSNGDLTSAGTDPTKNIPDATNGAGNGGYPFTQTKYTPDGTGRIAAQGGVGPTFQLGSEHETKYFYGKPLQEELDGLFGSEAGEHSHYFKNMVVDANKQVSVSYVDMHGRTIATALAGEPGTGGVMANGMKGVNVNNTADYPGQQGTGIISSDLITNGGNVLKGHSLESLNTILVTNLAHYTFNYQLPPATVSIPGCNGNITYTPKYDLEITMVDEATGKPVKLSDGITSFDIVLTGISSQGITTPLQYVTADLPVGSYSVRKTLTLREDLLQQDLEDYLKEGHGTCKKLEDFINDVFAAIKGACSEDGYISPTNACLELTVNNGQDYRQKFVNTYLNNLGINPLNATTTQTNEANAAANAAYAKAVQHCATFDNTVSHRLENIEASMLYDMTPYSGQYATNPTPANTAEAGIYSRVTGLYIPYGSMFNKYNIFSTSSSALHATPYYKTPLTDNYISGVSLPLYTKLYYFKADGTNASVTPLNEQPPYAILNALTPDEFAQQFKASWAKSLLPYHPEYNKLQFAKQNLKTAYDWIDGGLFAQTNTYQKAVTNGFINTSLVASDPFFALSGASSKKSDMEDFLNHAWQPPNSSNQLTMWQMAYGNAMCANAADNTARQACYANAPKYPPGYGPTITSGQDWATLTTGVSQDNLDIIWNSFKTLYQSVRDGMVNKYIDENSPVTDDETLISQGFVLHFPKDSDQQSEQMGSTATSGTDNNPNHWYRPSNTGSPQVNTVATTAQQAGQKNNMLAGYAKIWRNELLENDDFSNTSLVPANKLDNLLNLIITGSATDDGSSGTATGGFMGICRKAVDDAHTYGATDLPAGTTGIIDVDNSYSKSFEDVFNKALAYAKTNLNAGAGLQLGVYCNPYVIKFPKPYGGTPRVTDRMTGTVNNCMCTEYAARVTEAGSSVLNTSGNVDFEAFNTYLRIKYNETITQSLFDALQHCSSLPVITINAPVDDGTDYHQYTLSTPQPLPSFLVCGFTGGPQCLTCNKINTYSNDFVKLFPLPSDYTTVPLAPAGSNVLGQSDIDYNVLYANYLNYKTGLQQSWIDYQQSLSGSDHQQSCAITICSEGSIPGDLMVNDPATQPADGFKAATSITLSPGFDYAVVSSSSLSLTIDPQVTACGYSNQNDFALSCPVNQPYTYPDGIIQPQNPCRRQYDWAAASATHTWEEQHKVASGLFMGNYLAEALASREVFTVNYATAEYHYTLYYYDMAGSLVKTVPPAGARPDYSTAFLSLVKTARDNAAANGGNYGSAVTPGHILTTNYRYNSLGQAVAQNTPDAGTSQFWYDKLDRLVISQNAQQYVDNKYSYTLFDEFGRITEVGQKTQTTPITQDITQNDGAATVTATTTSPQSLANWLATNGGTTVVYNKEQITRTTYDVPYAPLQGDINQGAFNTYINQQNLRNRVSYSEVFDKEWDGIWTASTYTDQDGNVYPTTSKPGVDAWHASATYYTYDIHGNVNVLLQDYGSSEGKHNDMNQSGNRFKKTEYDYDLISGKVNQVAYQAGYADAVYHRYNYDAENRLTSVETSRDKIYYERDASYSYYKHGPLMQTQLGQLNVQELNYTYTLQGWLKSINAGWDGSNIIASTGNTPAPVYGFSLHYYQNDYKAIGSSTGTDVIFSGITGLEGNSPAGTNQLYNGNIAAMAVNIPQLGVGNTTNTGKPLVYHYGYDQLNRLVSMDAFSSTNSTFASLTKLNDYHEAVTYDPNGNIINHQRNGNTGTNGLAMDNLTYRYEKNNSGVAISNKLRYIYDDVQGNTGTEDIKTQTNKTLAQVQADNNSLQTGDNYAYDKKGNLIKNDNEGITAITWTVYGKIRTINKTVNGVNTVISYTYDVAGNRISKAVSQGTTTITTSTTWYVRDAGGNVVSIYSVGPADNGGELKQIEAPLYGSSRLGELKINANVNGTNLAITPIATVNNMPIYATSFTRGQKLFELSNHLGNVLATVSDRKLPGTDDNTNGQIDGAEVYVADVVTAQDYYPGGSVEPGRQYNAATQYRYGFNGKENDNDIETGAQDYGMRIYDSRIVRFLSVDPITAKYPELTPYQFASNSPIDGIDEDGLEWAPVYRKDGKTLTDYKWVGYNNDGTAKAGSVASGFINKGDFGISGGFSFVFSSDAKTRSGKINIYSNTASATSHGWWSDNSTAYNFIININGKFVSGNQGGWGYIQTAQTHNPSTGELSEPAYIGASNSRADPGGVGADEMFGRGKSTLGFNYPNPGINAIYPESILVPVGPEFKGLGFLAEIEGATAKGITGVEQYSLRAAEDGFYPVMKRGFRKAQELTWLNKGEVWKFGTTKNPFTRYTQSFLTNTGAGLRYATEFSGTLEEALILERMKILNFRGQNGFLPAGNKMLK